MRKNHIHTSQCLLQNDAPVLMMERRDTDAPRTLYFSLSLYAMSEWDDQRPLAFDACKFDALAQLMSLFSQTFFCSSMIVKKPAPTACLKLQLKNFQIYRSGSPGIEILSVDDIIRVSSATFVFLILSLSQLDSINNSYHISLKLTHNGPHMVYEIRICCWFVARISLVP